MIVGNKLAIRAVEKEDLIEYLKWVNDYEFKRLYNFTIDFSSYDKMAAFIERNSSSKDTAAFSILDKDTNKLIGRCMLTEIDLVNKKSMCMIHIEDVDYRDSSYASEVMRLLMKFAFEDLGLNRLGAWVFDFNKFAIRCYKSCGMKVEGIMREGVYRDGKYHDVYIMGILKCEYEEIMSGGDGACLEENM